MQIKISETANNIWNTLIDAGYPTYIVGGAVRDYMTNQEYHDIDFATKATPDQIKELFSSFDNHKHFKMDFVGESFGVMIINGIEIATFRGDQYFGDGDKDVEITYLDTIEEDLARRDLTINAMAIDIDGNLIDPFGGVEDISNAKIKFVGNAEDRINEDPNRILRALRFASRFNMSIDNDTWDAIINAVDNGKIDMIAPERIRLEIIKTMESSKFASAFWMYMLEAKILDIILPEMVDGVNHDHGNHHIEDIWTHNMVAGNHIDTEYPLLKLAAYLHDVGKPASYDKEKRTFHEHQHLGADIVRNRLSALKFSNDEIKYIVNLVLIHMDGTRGMSAKSRRRLKNKLNRYDLDWEHYVMIRIADRVGNLSREDFTPRQIQDYIDMFTIEEEVPFSVNDLVLSGGDIIRIFELTPSPIVGKIQRELLQQVIDKGDEFNTAENLITHILIKQLTDAEFSLKKC